MAFRHGLQCGQLWRIGVQRFFGLSHGHRAPRAIGGYEKTERTLLLRGCGEQTMALIRIGVGAE